MILWGPTQQVSVWTLKEQVQIKAQPLGQADAARDPALPFTRRVTVGRSLTPPSLRLLPWGVGHTVPRAPTLPLRA